MPQKYNMQIIKICALSSSCFSFLCLACAALYKSGGIHIYSAMNAFGLWAEKIMVFGVICENIRAVIKISARRS